MEKIPDNILDKRSVEILTDVLNKTSGSHEGINATRYRVDNIKDIEKTTSLADKHLLDYEQNNDTYRVNPVGLLFIQNSKSKKIFSDIDKITDYLCIQYKKTLNDPLLISALVKPLKLTRKRLNECVYYLQKATSIGVSIDNIQKEETKITPRESLLTSGKITEILHNRLKSWFPDAFKKEKKRESPHGNTEINAQKRADVLGAALAVLAAYTPQCRAGSGNIKGNKIAKLVEDNSLLLFKEYDGIPPLEPDAISRLINKWINTLK